MTEEQEKEDKHKIDVFGCTITIRGSQSKRMGKMRVHYNVYKYEKERANQSGRSRHYWCMCRHCRSKEIEEQTTKSSYARHGAIMQRVNPEKRKRRRQPRGATKGEEARETKRREKEKRIRKTN